MRLWLMITGTWHVAFLSFEASASEGHRIRRRDLNLSYTLSPSAVQQGWLFLFPKRGAAAAVLWLAGDALLLVPPPPLCQDTREMSCPQSLSAPCLFFSVPVSVLVRVVVLAGGPSPGCCYSSGMAWWSALPALLCSAPSRYY